MLLSCSVGKPCTQRGTHGICVWNTAAQTLARRRRQRCMPPRCLHGMLRLLRSGQTPSAGTPPWCPQLRLQPQGGLHAGCAPERRVSLHLRLQLRGMGGAEPLVRGPGARGRGPAAGAANAAGPLLPLFIWRSNGAPRCLGQPRMPPYLLPFDDPRCSCVALCVPGRCRRTPCQAAAAGGATQRPLTARASARSVQRGRICVCVCERVCVCHVRSAAGTH